MTKPKQKGQLIETLNELSVGVGDTIQKLLKDPYNVQEIGEFTTFMRLSGLSGHKMYSNLNNLFTLELKNIFKDEQAIVDLNKASSNQNTGMVIGTILIGLGVFTFFYLGDDLEELAWIPIGLDILGIVVGVAIMTFSQSKEMKDFEKLYKNLINEIQNTNISPSEINIELVAEADTKNDSNLLDS